MKIFTIIMVLASVSFANEKKDDRAPAQAPVTYPKASERPDQIQDKVNIETKFRAAVEFAIQKYPKKVIQKVIHRFDCAGAPMQISVGYTSFNKSGVAIDGGVTNEFLMITIVNGTPQVQAYVNNPGRGYCVSK